MRVPFLDLKIQYKQIEQEVMPMITRAMADGAFVGGEQVSCFETEFAKFCNSSYCVGVNSGTDALRFALMAIGVGPGDEVITVPNTFIATTEAISQVGAKPVFVDIYPDTCNMDPNKLEDYLKNRLKPNASSLTPRPKAVIPVHLYGQPANMDPILEIAQKNGIAVIEDACQAHGANYDISRKAGAMGAVGCFSFYPGKNLGAFGEGGAIITENESIAQKIRMIRDHGQHKKYFHDLEGYNGRLDAIQAGVLRIKLKRLGQWNKLRRKNAAYYHELLSEIPSVTLLTEAEFAESVYHLYVILVDDRDGLQQFLASKGIATGLHYPLPLHLQKAYTDLGYKKGDFPITENIAGRLIS
ncbi:MAG: DegT/DnrJ/EryC1/StrS family aminotransferase, partial [Thermodesulfobacteriota bacterium]|nr:DegT/DnrJ/EryC1/StrS family aminotransferase [Thermodesulfobacteriota bacterium]